jgi:hypothetical protein
LGRMQSQIADTLPAIDACMGTDITPSASAMTCALITRSPTFTMGTAGLPICWDMGIRTFRGGEGLRIDFLFVNCFFSGGCTPPLKEIAVKKASKARIYGIYKGFLSIP